jgi:hypothetical protein
MSIPVAFQSFKSAGIYRVVYDKSTVLSQDTQVTRLVVGYSPQGPFNTPVLVRSVSEFKALYGGTSKSLEKRGVFFHRLAMQALTAGPILCLNLKKFDGEQLDAATVDTTFNPELTTTSPIGTVKLNVEDIYDTTRFWELSAFKLAELGATKDSYIALSETNTKDTAVSFFLRKASGTKVSAYNVTVNDWYKDAGEEVPEYLQDKLNNKISDFFAEIYFFKGEFKADQVMTSETLKNYFVNGTNGLQLRKYVTNAYGDAVDTLDSLYNDSTSGAISHYVGCLIPYFKDKYGVYQSLDILVNNDVDTNNVMMNFNVDLLEENKVNIDLSGCSAVKGLVADLYAGTATTTLLGNVKATVVSDKITFDDSGNATAEQLSTDEAVYGSSVSFVKMGDYKGDTENGVYKLISKTSGTLADFLSVGDRFAGKNGVVYVQETGSTVRPVATETNVNYDAADVTGAVVNTNYKLSAAADKADSLPNLVKDDIVKGVNGNVTVLDIGTEEHVTEDATTEKKKYIILSGEPQSYTNTEYNTTYYVKLTLGPDTEKVYYVGLTGEPVKHADNNDNYLVRIDNPLNQETGTLSPVYLAGYTYKNYGPKSTSMDDKQKWQDTILSTLTEYKGIREALLNRSNIDYRYVVDTFETYVTAGAKNVLSYLCKEKQSAFAILNFPSVRTFIKCPYASFTDSKGIFNVDYIVKGYNPKKSHNTGFTLPTESEGASFCAFYTPLKFSDGYLDTIVPSAALVSNLFVEKYSSRQPYYIVAGPNYGNISASGMTGPDYNYSREELNIIEPFGVNCMVYRPGFGTFINANQTAKQTPKSALSSVNVRELVIYLQDEIEKVLQSYQWEFNNQTVRNKIKDKADTICARVQANGGLQDYENIMDESNNTSDIIDNEMAVLSTHIEPGRGMGKLIHELTLYRTGQMRAAISES